MGILENLVQGFASAAGADDSVRAIQKNKDDRRATAHEELEGNTKRIFDDLRGLQTRKQNLDPNSPTYKKDSEAIDADIAKVGTAFHDLYHPANNPTALHHLGGFIKQHILHQPVPSTPAQAKESLQDLMRDIDIGGHVTAAPAPASPAPNPILVKRQQMKDAGYTDEDIAKAEHRSVPTPSGEAKPVKQTSDERARADFAEYMKKHPKYEGTFERWKREQSTLPKAPKAPTAAKLTPAQNAAQKDYLAADKLSNIADAVAKNPDDAVNQKRLAVALERISAGRFTTQALDYIIKAGWGNTLEQWANNPRTGALPKDVMRQLVDGAHQNLDAAQKELQKADDLAPKIPKTPKEAKDAMKKVGAADDEDDFLKKL